MFNKQARNRKIMFPIKHVDYEKDVLLMYYLDSVIMLKSIWNFFMELMSDNHFFS